MPINSRNFEYVVLDMIESANRNFKTNTLNLGGVAGSGGGLGGPPGGFIGTLPQYKVSYDMSEDSTDYTPASGMSLLDNLNHIRHRLTVVESGGGGLPEAPIDGSTYGRKDGAWAVISGVAISGVEEAPIDGNPYERKDGTWVVASGGGAGTFLDLSDTPNSYSGQGGKYVVVASGGSGLEFVTSSGGVGTTPIMEQIWEYMASNNSSPIDYLLTSGSYKCFIYLDTQNSASWKAATTASYTVPTGKKLIVLQSLATNLLAADYANRRARFYNSSDSVEVIPHAYFHSNGFPFVEGSPTGLKTVAAGKTVRIEIWSGDANARAAGGVVICRELDV